MHADRVEIVRRDDAPRRAFGSIADAERGPGDLLRDERVDERGAALKLDEVRPRHVVRARRAAIGSTDGEQPVLVDDERIRTKQNAFDPTEDGGVRADSQGEAPDRQERKAGTAPEHPKTEAQIVEHREPTLAAPLQKR